MCPAPVLANLAELHTHLGASTRPHFLWELAHDQGIRLPEKDYWRFEDAISVKDHMPSAQYMRRLDLGPQEREVSPFALTQRIQSSPFAIEKCVHEAISIAYRRDNVTLLEMRFNPMLRNRNGEQDLDRIILAAAIGMKKATLEYPVKAGLILESDRQFTREQHEIIARKAVLFKVFGVVGIDLSGPSPADFTIDSWVGAAKIARDGGLGVTIHTGEVTSAEEVEEVVEKIQPHRIGHGLRALSNPSLIKKIEQKGIVLELCPTSNIKTSVVDNWEEMGQIIKALDSYGVQYTINSDGPELLQTSVKIELETLYEKGILDDEGIARVVRTAHNHSFISL